MSRQTLKSETVLQKAQTRGRRLLAGLFFFVVCVLIVDALVGDQGLIATMRARKQYDELAATLRGSGPKTPGCAMTRAGCVKTPPQSRRLRGVSWGS